jgi:NADP-dependent 3-hydroxy acid dehydrogenase YdfG
VLVASATDEAAVKKVATAVGTWDVLLMAAGYVSPGHILTANVADYWQNYEVSLLKSINHYGCVEHR